MKVLVVVDMQNDFITGPLGTPEAQAIVPKVCELIKSDYDEIFFTEDIHGDDYLYTHEGRWLPTPHCLVCREGQLRIPEIREILLGKCHVISKNSFGATLLWPAIKGLQESTFESVTVDICGVCTDICVISNALMLRSYFPEMDIRVIKDACAGTDPDMHWEALRVMKNCHIEVV